MVKYATGNYYDLVHPKKTDGVENRHAYIVGAGLAGLASAVILIRDGYMPGENITIFEEKDQASGSLEAFKDINGGYISPGGREMEDHYECLWNLYSSVPSLDEPGKSCLDEYYYLDKEDPNKSNCRLIHDRGHQLKNDNEYTLDYKALKEMIDLVLVPESKLDGKTIEDVFDDNFFASNFWTDWQTMFAFERWQSAAEMRRYLMHFIHHVDGLTDFTALKFNRYDDYQSMSEPLVAYLKDHHVNFEYQTQVENVEVKHDGEQIAAHQIDLNQNGKSKSITVNPMDLVFVTNGSITESTTYGSHDEAPIPNESLGGSWKLWEKLAAQDNRFGHPDVFCKTIPEKAWKTSATLTLKNKDIAPYIEKLTKRPLFNYDKCETSGIITITDSNWGMSFTIHRQPAYKGQPKDEVILWLYGLYSDTKGNYVQKRMPECSGKELTEELLYHLGVPEDKIAEMADIKNIQAIPDYMPFITSYFQLRTADDRPDVVPQGSTNLAFIGNFADSGTRDVVFTTEYSVRTAIEAVYELLKIDHTVPEVYPSVFDIRTLMSAMYYLNDKKTLEEMDLPITEKLGAKLLLKKVKGTWIEELLKDSKLI
ncbi:oleate hydratase [Fructilactobacillus lindneri]|uniref:Oxidoreductase n=2 Tax=Fructilactobacillus lindneri TaxID=53444 RepID=A0A0R2JLZ5_9LACO|nr:oleate hydratase [Fructilactobacillus lindneri]ANZ57590.1 oleate hydratase [Fructilactobacillus lindneri]ANZ58859.1 oleate hydratase [Fructilactobacillus lindneri]KRN78217.1 oxidoreductase [Fructilactobacillus lindneri DSM 20690 = JCM 11027]POG97741.1 oleate hydratase [Fructilactobacillus lindneri]POH00034.1 oleate hydratase [Fructilactobacillus lindneri]